MYKMKRIGAKILWKIFGLSRIAADLFVDIFGYDNYMKIAELKN